jgi:hypothetical protein
MKFQAQARKRLPQYGKGMHPSKGKGFKALNIVKKNLSFQGHNLPKIFYRTVNLL